MSLPNLPPTVTQSMAPVRGGSNGWPTYAMQSGLNDSMSKNLTLDGACGPATVEAIKSAQATWRLEADGVAGPATKTALSGAVCRRLDGQVAAMPNGLCHNFARGEGGDNPAAVNWTVPEGVDCGLFQFRVYGPPYSARALLSAFAPFQSALAASIAFLGRQKSYVGKGWCQNSSERTGRCAVMAHNWPAGAAQIAQAGHVSNPSGRCTWVPRDASGRSLVKFPDGTRVESRDDWTQFYAMGGSHGEAVMCEGVVWS